MNEVEFDTEYGRLRADRSHGASSLARQTLELLGRSAAHLGELEAHMLCRILEQRCDRLAQVRPSMAVIGAQVQRWQAELQKVCNPGVACSGTPLSSQQLAAHMAQYAIQMISESQCACGAAAGHMAALIKPGQTLITLSSSSTLDAVFARLNPQMHIIVAESRPLNEGVEVTRSLLQRGFDVTLITDAQMGLFAPQADMALIGADTVLADGSVVNKARSYLLALAAHAAGVKVYCCHESYKKCSLEREEFAIEAMDVAELGHPEIPAAAQQNLYFDCTPPHLISARVTEHGVEE